MDLSSSLPLHLSGADLSGLTISGAKPTAIFSQRFGDYYFSNHDGLAETKYVYLAGNDLPAAWQTSTQRHFTIGETGFGTGMNFMAAWQAFEQTISSDTSNASNKCLHYVGVELFPLDRRLIGRFLRPLFPAHMVDRFLAQYPFPVPGFHHMQLTDRVSLTLIFDDVVDGFSQLSGQIDAWFLDGFSPSQNPDMWRDAVFEQLARLSSPGATLASFTAAGFVRRGLQKAGFHIEKTKGFARKRDMIKGRFIGLDHAATTDKHKSSQAAPPARPLSTTPLPRIAVIGAGLAGAACAYQFARTGHDVAIFDQAPHPASGASGNPVGLFNPRPFAQRHARNEYHIGGLELAARRLRHLAQDHDIDYRLCGCLHLDVDEKASRRHDKAMAGMGWPGDLMRRVTPGEATSIAGIKITRSGLYSPLAGAVSPPKLVRAYMAHHAIAPEYNCRITRLYHDGAQWHLYGQNDQYLGNSDVVITTRPIDHIQLEDKFLPNMAGILRPVKGQVTQWHIPQSTYATSRHARVNISQLRCNISHGGYISRLNDTNMIMGATFHRGQSDPAPIPSDDYQNYYQLKRAMGDVPALNNASPDFSSRRASVRLTTGDHMPILGAYPQAAAQGLYISTGWGSHGILGTILGAQILYDMVAQTPHSAPLCVLKAIHPNRFTHIV